MTVIGSDLILDLCCTWFAKLDGTFRLSGMQPACLHGRPGGQNRQHDRRGETDKERGDAHY